MYPLGVCSQQKMVSPEQRAINNTYNSHMGLDSAGTSLPHDAHMLAEGDGGSIRNYPAGSLLEDPTVQVGPGRPPHCRKQQAQMLSLPLPCCRCCQVTVGLKRRLLLLPHGPTSFSITSRAEKESRLKTYLLNQVACVSETKYAPCLCFQPAANLVISDSQ